MKPFLSTSQHYDIIFPGVLFSPNILRENMALITSCVSTPSNTKHLYSNCTTLAQRLRRWSSIVHMLYKCFVVIWTLYHMHFKIGKVYLHGMSTQRDSWVSISCWATSFKYLIQGRTRSLWASGPQLCVHVDQLLQAEHAPSQAAAKHVSFSDW